MLEPLSKTNPKFYGRIKALHENIWQNHIDPTTKRTWSKWSNEKRNLTDYEKSCLFSLMSSRRVTCCMHDRFGFTLIVSLYIYPKRNSEEPEFLISFSHKHMGIENVGLEDSAKAGEKTALNIFSKSTYKKTDSL